MTPRHTSPEPAFPGALDQMLEAIRAEKAAVRHGLGFLGDEPRVPLLRGRLRIDEPGACVYRFACELEHEIPQGTRVTVEAPGQRVAGEVVDHDVEQGSIDLVLREDLGPDVPDARLAFDPTWLLDRLADRLDTIRQTPLGADGVSLAPPGGAPLFVDRAMRFLQGSATPHPPLTIERAGLAREQAAAVGQVLARDVAYLWGPPGTGKTTTVAHLVHELIERGERVLLCAHTNVATDTALLRVLETGSLPPAAVVRVGYHVDQLRPWGVGLDHVADRRARAHHPELARAIEEACAAVAATRRRPPAALTSDRTPLGRRLRIAQELGADPGESDPLGSRQLADLAGQLDTIEQAVVDGARLVACTLTSCHTSRRLCGLRTDSVVIDEASTASLALSFVAACLARVRAVAVGDFMQLPTIVQAEQPAARFWLGRHVFNSARCDRPERDHPLRAMLPEQYRMHPGISRVVSQVFYAGRLLDAPPVRDRAHEGPSVMLLDTQGLSARSEFTAAKSRRNRVHASLVAELVSKAPGVSIAVITPYRAQVQAIRDAIRALDPGGLASGRVEVFTVHRFQGRDKDAVVFDTCEAPGTPVGMLSDLVRAEAPNLINVALSRARDRLVIVASMQHVTESPIMRQVLVQARMADALECTAGRRPDDAAIAAFLPGGTHGDPRN